MSSDKLENFIRAFEDNCSGRVRTCNCGKVFYDSENTYDWEPGEIEGLMANSKCTALEYSVETIMFENKECVADCDCWHPRAKQIMGFLDSHSRGIAAYLTLEKKRKQAEADDAPIVKDDDEKD